MEPKRFSTLPYAKQIEWRKKNGIEIPEEERMALLFNRLVATPLSHLYSGTGLFILGMFEPASVELEKAAEQLGNQASGSMVQYYLGLVYQERGQTASARQALETFISHSRSTRKISGLRRPSAPSIS